MLPVEKLEQEFYAPAESEGIRDFDDLNRTLDRALNLRAFLKADACLDGNDNATVINLVRPIEREAEDHAYEQLELLTHERKQSDA